MEVLYLLVPLALLFVAFAVGAFVWAVGDGQFDDPRGPAVRMLDDADDEVPGGTRRESESDSETPPR